MTGNGQFMYIESREQPHLHTLRANPSRTRSAASHFPYQRHRSPVRHSKGAHSERMGPQRGWSANNNKPIKSVVSGIRVVRLCLNAKSNVIYRILELYFYVPLWIKRLKPVRRCDFYLLLFKSLR